MRRVCMLLGVVIVLSLSVATPVTAQRITNGAENRELLRMGLYPPDLLMRHQQKLGITDTQRKRIAALVRDFQEEVADLQWNLQNDQQTLNQALSGYPISAADTLEHAQKVLVLESEFKLAHFRLLIGIKNVLSKEQVDLIDALIKQRRRNGRL
ncbi:MAG: Spy/CpxP family protein refolding chaperone [Halioglobus sp.]